jgi:hypothetical protein
MALQGGRGYIAPTQSRPRHSMRVSGQSHSPVALYPQGKDPRYPSDRRLGGPQSWSGQILCPRWGSNLDRPVVQSVARHYYD